MAAKHPRGAPDTGGGPIRILLVICRPRAGEDVPFRSVAAKLLKGLDEASREIVALEVLRPPTFEGLAKTLRAAKTAGKPYHVVHFDGHGAYLDDEDAKKLPGLVSGVSPHVLDAGRKGKHGYLLFEAADEAAKESGELVGGPALGQLLVETGVPVLVLNACRSAHADPPPEPEKKEEGAKDTHGDVASFGSLALEVMDKGVSGVVAMRYNVYVVTAAQFVADLYGALADGRSLGEAVSLGRKQLAAKPQREIGFDPVPLQDWCVPVVYEAERLPLFPEPPSKRIVKLEVGGGEGTAAPGALVGVPEAPDVGFFGRDETLLALDRAFDRHPIVLLHAYAGSGKTSTAAEFARWYARTGGVEGPVLWTSFERRMVLPQVLDALARAFAPVIERNRINWLALPLEEQRRVALQILEQVPVLWVWDNVEPVAGFPEGTASAWTAEEQADLVGFLRESRRGKAKFLLTSRRDDQGWLGELPARVKVPGMPMQERVQLARALASRRGRKLGDVKDWRPLLEFTQGNPMTITVLVGQALRDGVKTREQVEAFVAKLRAGEKAFTDEDEKEGRSRSLGASLSYGFGEAFGEGERKVLALLHLFQGFVDEQVLRAMGNPEAPWCLPEVRGLTRETGIALLDKAAEVGLLTARGGGCYGIHPAVPWYFRGMFEGYYPEVRLEGEGSDATGARRAFVEAMGGLGSFYHNRYEAGHRDMLDVLETEEPNLLHARDLARRHSWWGSVAGAMQGLRTLYDHTSRRAEWARLVDEVTCDFVDPENDGPLPGREEYWGLVSEYRVHLAEEARRWVEAEGLQQTRVRWARERAAPALALPDEALDGAGRYAIQVLAGSLEGLGRIQRERGQAECIASFTEAATTAKRAGDRVGEAGVAFNLGHAHMDFPAAPDLAEAEHWYRYSLEMLDEKQRHLRAKCLAQLGAVARRRFKGARATKRPVTELLEHLNGALRSYQEALALLPPDAVDDLAVSHAGIANCFGDAGDLDRALPHYQDAIRYMERAGNVYDAARTRFNVAVDLANAARLTDARAYALAALRNFETYGDRAADDIQDTHALLAAIDRRLAQPKPT